MPATVIDYRVTSKGLHVRCPDCRHSTITRSDLDSLHRAVAVHNRTRNHGWSSVTLRAT